MVFRGFSDVLHGPGRDGAGSRFQVVPRGFAGGSPGLPRESLASADQYGTHSWRMAIGRSNTDAQVIGLDWETVDTQVT